MELHGALRSSEYLAGAVIEGVIHLNCAPGQESGCLDWLATRAHGQWRLSSDSGSLPALQAPLVGNAPGIIACDVVVQGGDALTYVLRIPLPPVLPPSYRSAAPARAGARERAGGGINRLEYAVHVDAQRRAGNRILTASLQLPFEVVSTASESCARAKTDAAGAWLAPTPAALASSTATELVPLSPSPERALSNRDDCGEGGGESPPVQVELQVAGSVLGVVSLPGGALLGDNGSSAVTVSLALHEDSPLVCVAACARLEVVEQTVVAGKATGPVRTVTVGECDAHTEHTSSVTLSLLRPALSPPELAHKPGCPITCRWQLALDLAVRARHDPLAACSSLNWAYPLAASTDPGFPSTWRERSAGAFCGAAGTVRF